MRDQQVPVQHGIWVEITALQQQPWCGSSPAGFVLKRAAKLLLQREQ